jgi:hypothetical protein
MERPNFTEQEEKLLSYIQIGEDSCMSSFLFYLPWILIPTASFLYGFFTDEPALVIAGFSLIFFLTIRFAYYQINPRWRLKPIIEKYEACFDKKESQPADSADG